LFTLKSKFTKERIRSSLKLSYLAQKGRFGIFGRDMKLTTRRRVTEEVIRPKYFARSRMEVRCYLKLTLPNNQC